MTFHRKERNLQASVLARDQSALVGPSHILFWPRSRAASERCLCIEQQRRVSRDVELQPVW